MAKNISKSNTATREQIKATLDMYKNVTQMGNGSFVDLDSGETFATYEELQTALKAQEETSEGTQLPTEKEAVDASGEPEWKPANKFADMIPFVDWTKTPEYRGIYLGEGKIIGEGTMQTKTHLFYDPVKKGYNLIPQWGALNDLLEDTELGTNVYKIVNHGKVEMNDGSKRKAWSLSLWKAKSTIPHIEGVHWHRKVLLG